MNNARDRYGISALLLRLAAVATLAAAGIAGTSSAAPLDSTPVSTTFPSSAQPRGDSPPANDEPMHGRSDAAITDKVMAGLLTDRALQGGKVHVLTRGGIVTLTGETATQAAKARAEQSALAIDGVKRVNNQLTAPAAD